MKDMNILMLAPFYNVYIKEFTEVLANYVSSITVVVHHNPLTEISKYLPKRGYIRYLYRYTKDNLIDGEGTPDNVDIEIVSLPYFIPDGKNLLLGDRVFKKVNKIIQQDNIEFDVIHAHSTWISGYVGAKIKREYKKPIIITLHSVQEVEIRTNSTEILNKILWTWKIADFLISVNKEGKERIRNTIKEDKIAHIPNGFDAFHIYPTNKKIAREILSLDLDKKIIFSFGSLIKRKGFNYLVDAMKYIIKYRDDVICFIGGEGPMRDQLNKQIKQFGLNNHVKLVGHIPENKKNHWLNASDVFVFPSLRETFGIPVLEALAVGTPAVATINGGSEELIVSEEYGLLAKPADPEDLAEKILIALEKDWNREKIRKYAEQFTWDNIAKQTLEVYKKTLSTSSTK